MAEKKIHPVQPAAAEAKSDEAAPGEQRKTANFRGFRKLASVRFGRKTNMSRI